MTGNYRLHRSLPSAFSAKRCFAGPFVEEIRDLV
jgi:hypothetical protein